MNTPTGAPTKEKKRDPQVDPLRGDVVQLRDGRYRRIADRRGNDIHYFQGKDFGKPTQTENLRLCKCWITTWMDWCTRNDVVTP